MEYIENCIEHIVICLENGIDFFIRSINDTTALANLMTIVSVLLAFGAWLITKIVKLYRLKKYKKTKRPIYINEEMFEQCINNYVKTQVAQPSGKKYNFDKFVKKVLIKGKKQYHLILGEAGTGKSTFLLNLYYRYRCKIFTHDYYIEYFPLRKEGVLDEISKIKNQTHTILLLDGFDEAIGSNINPETFLNTLEMCTQYFAKVIISSRNNFFDNDAAMPSRVGVVSILAARPEKYNRYYIQPFTLNDIIFYLLKEYKINIFKIIKAMNIITKCKEIACRPLLISYIDLLIKDEIVHYNSFELYQHIINNWIKRESFFIEQKSDEVMQIIEQQMYAVINEIAVFMYNRYPQQKDFYIKISDLNNIKYVALLEKTRGKRNRSLFNRIDDKLYFSHRSIFEYLLAINFDKLNFRFETNLNVLYAFLQEIAVDFSSKYSALFYVNYQDKYPEITEMRGKENKIQLLVCTRDRFFLGRNQIEEIVRWHLQALMMPVMIKGKFYKREFFKIDILGKQVARINRGNLSINNLGSNTEWIKVTEWIMDVIKKQYIMKKESFTFSICTLVEPY